MKRNISIIIPTHNRPEKLKRLLDSINESSKPADLFLNIIIIVDNSSKYIHSSIIHAYPNLHYINGDGNWWFTKSINEGLKYANKLKPDYCLILNDDVVISSNYFHTLLSSFNSVSNMSIIASVTLSEEEPHKVIFSGIEKIIRWRFKLLRYHPFFSNYNNYSMKGLHHTMVFPGRGTLIPNEIVTQLNYFDPYFRQYHSDGDFCLRALKNGYKTYVNWEAILYTSIRTTNSSTSYLNKSLFVLIKSFFNPYSRNYIPQKIKFIWRHGIPILMPITLTIFIGAMIINVFKKNSDGL